MIEFKRLELGRKTEYERYLRGCGKGCEYSFVNLSIWGRQEAAIIDGSLVLFSQFGRNSVYPFPIIRGDAQNVLDTVIADAKSRGIRCRFTALNAGDCELLERLYPGQFRFYPDRDSYDYVYPIDALADLKGKKLQRKRNHLNRFRLFHPNCRALPLDGSNLYLAQGMAEHWFKYRATLDPEGDYHLERMALRRAFARFQALGLEGMMLLENDKVLAMTLGSQLSEDTFDVHFEKAREDVDGAYAAINSEFARYLRSKYPGLRYLNREDDLGLPGLRKAKLSYCPEFLVEKFWAKLVEDEDED